MSSEQPIPQGNYLPAVRYGDLINTSGMTPRIKGELQFVGQIGADDPLDDHRAAVELATSNALVAVEGLLSENERIVQIRQLSVFINAEQGFTAHAALADFASQQIAKIHGSACIGARAAIGVASLPRDAPVEILLVAIAGNI